MFLMSPTVIYIWILGCRSSLDAIVCVRRGWLYRRVSLGYVWRSVFGRHIIRLGQRLAFVDLTIHHAGFSFILMPRDVYGDVRADPQVGFPALRGHSSLRSCVSTNKKYATLEIHCSALSGYLSGPVDFSHASFSMTLTSTDSSSPTLRRSRIRDKNYVSGRPTSSRWTMTVPQRLILHVLISRRPL